MDTIFILRYLASDVIGSARQGSLQKVNLTRYLWRLLSNPLLQVCAPLTEATMPEDAEANGHSLSYEEQEICKAGVAFDGADFLARKLDVRPIPAMRDWLE